MSYVINCNDGVTLRADSIEELLDSAEDHIRRDHPDLVGRVGREDLRAQATEV